MSYDLQPPLDLVGLGIAGLGSAIFAWMLAIRMKRQGVDATVGSLDSALNPPGVRRIRNRLGVLFLSMLALVYLFGLIVGIAGR